jgi:chemosensory pili system protein ChpE
LKEINMSAWPLFLSTFGLGLVYNATPGPINLETLRRGNQQGFRASLWVQMGAVIGEGIWATITFLGLTWVLRHPLLHIVLGGIAIFLSARMAVALWQQRTHTSHVPDTSDRHPFVWGVLWSVVNPTSMAFWLTAGVGLVSTHDLAPRLIIFSAFLTSTLLWAVCAAGISQWTHTHLTLRLHHLMQRGCAGIMLGCGGLACWNIVHLL